MDAERASLIERAAARLARRRGRRIPTIDWRFAGAMASVIALGPLLTIMGAHWLEAQARARAMQIAAELAPRMVTERADRAARAALRESARDATVAGWIDRAASAIPGESRVVRVTKTGDGAIEMEVLTADPDAMRAHMRRAHALTGFRETGQRRAGAAMVVTMRHAP